VPRLSIIIPVPDDPIGLEETLLSLLENRPDPCQIVVVIGGDYDDPYDLAGEVDFVQIERGVGLIGCINVGICASSAPIVHPLLSGTEVGQGWAEAALTCFDDPEVAAVAPLIIDREDRSHVLTAGMGYRRAGIVRDIGHGLAVDEFSRSGHTTRPSLVFGPDIRAGFYRKAALRKFGLFDVEAGECFSTLDMALSVQRAGLTCLIEPRCRMVAGKTPPVSIGRWRRGWQLERLFRRWMPREGRLGASAGHALVVLAECIQCIVRPSMALQVAGRMAAMTALRIRPDRRAMPEPVSISPEIAALPRLDTPPVRRSSAA